MLPYEPVLLQDEEDNDPAIYQGIWPSITDDEWLHHLYIETLQTLNNKDLLVECS